MIIPMKKVSILVMDKEKDTSLEKLRDLGIMHLERKTVSSPDLTKLMNRRTQLEIASGILAAFAPKKGQKTEHVLYSGDLSNHVIALFERRKKLQDYIFHHQRERENFERWGEFNPKDFKYVVDNGVPMYLYHISEESYEKNVGDVPVLVLSHNKKHKTVRFVAFGEVPHETPRPLPDRPLSEVNARDQIRKEELGRIEAELVSLSHLKKQLDAECKAILADIEFATAHASMELIDEEAAKEAAENPHAPDMAISWLSGYIPTPDLGQLKRAASENGWAFCADDPDLEDVEVPTKLKNSKFSQLLSPVTDFLELVPGYREADITFWFLVFFMIFFGMIFGDAAYGSILFLIAIIGIMKTAPKGVPMGFKFLLLMSVSNIVWGALAGSWFAMDPAKVPQVLMNLSLPLITNTSAEPGWLEAYNESNLWIQAGLFQPINDLEVMKTGVSQHLMFFCFTLALLQLGVAHIRNFFVNIRAGSLKFLGEMGRFGLLFGMYFVVLSLIVFGTGFGGVQMWQLYCIGGGWLLIFFFGSFEKSMGQAIKSSVSNIVMVVLNITNVFSDIMSYIRLWAVGIAGAAIAGMINDAVGPMAGHFIFFTVGIAFFAVGHGFNMVLNVLAVLVHAVRLNILEFSSHVGINWAGFAYKPFAKRK